VQGQVISNLLLQLISDRGNRSYRPCSPSAATRWRRSSSAWTASFP